MRANGKPIFFDLRFTKLAGLRTVANAPGFSNVTDYWIAPEVIAKGIHAAGTDADTFAICASLERIFLNQADSRTQAVRTVLAAGIEPTPHKRPTISTINQRLQSLLTKKISRNRPKLPDARYWDEDLEIPFRGNLYKVVARLGQGGFGSTFKVVQINEQKREEVGYFVAKAIHDPNIGPAALEAYTKARAHAIHSNLAAILEVSNHWQPNQMAVLMSWIHGVTMLDLAGRLRQHAESVQESSTESLVLLWIRQLCDGLQRLHKAGFIHGDITPTNIIVSGRDVRLTDYDLVTRIGVGAIAKSTPAYCSPVMDAQDKVTPADDLFSLAASFFHVLFARLPFEQNGTTRKEKGLNWSNLDVSQAKVVSEFFGRATAPALADRFDSIDQALQFLSDRELSSRIEQQLLGHPEKSADPHTAVTSTVELETGASCAIEATSRWENAANALNNLLMAYMNKQRLEYAKLLSIYIVDFCGKHLSSAHPAVQQSKSIFDQLQAEGGHAVNSESGPKDRFSELFKHLNELTHEFLDASDWSTYDELIDLQLQVRERAIGYKSHTFVDKLRKIADQYIEFARYEKAEPLINRALKIRAETHKGQGTAIAGLLDRLTCIYVRQRKYPEAESIGRRLLKIRKQSNDTEGLGKTWHTLGLLYSSQDNCDKALHAFEQSLRLRKQSRSSHNQRAIAELMLDYAKLLRRVNQEKRATQMERLAEGLMRKKLPDAT